MPCFLYILLLLAILLGGGGAAWLRVRRLRTRTVVQTLASIVSQNLPLSAALRAAARAERGKLRRTYESLATRLEVGDDLCTALRVSHPTCPGEIVGAIHGAERGGTLPAVLQSLAADGRREFNDPQSSGKPLWYLVAIVALTPLVTGFVLIYIVPKYREIFTDYGIGLPAMTVALMDLGYACHRYSPLFIFAAVAVAAAIAQSLIGRHFLVRVPERFQITYALWDTLVWHLPLIRRLTRNRALARQLPVMQAAVRAGHDLGEAARQAGCVAVNLHARRRLLRWVDALEVGGDPLDAARRLRFPAPVLRALASAREGADLGANLEYIAEYYSRLHVHWERMLVSALAPLLVICWALCVGYIALALFLPLITLTNSVADSVH